MLINVSNNSYLPRNIFTQLVFSVVMPFRCASCSLLLGRYDSAGNLLRQRLFRILFGLGDNVGQYNSSLRDLVVESSVGRA